MKYEKTLDTFSSLKNRIEKIYSDRPEFVKISINFFPIIGVLFLNWDYFLIIMTYITETFIIGIINALKMIRAKGEIEQTTQPSYLRDTRKNTLYSRILLTLFFLFHYNIFILAQIVFVSLSDIMTSRNSHPISYDFIIGIVLFAFSHALAYRKNYIKKKQYLKISPNKLMLQPYKRIMIQQITVILGSSLLISMNSPIYMVAILVLLKMLFDVFQYKKTP